MQPWNVHKSPKIAKNGEYRARRETENSRDEGNCDKIDKNGRSCISRDMTSKIPRLMKHNALLSARDKFRLYPV